MSENLAEGPKIKCRRDGSIEHRVWYDVDGFRHRVDGPSDIWYDADGAIECEFWYQHSKHHRADGPAWIWYDSEGTINGVRWRLHGRTLTLNKFLSAAGVDRKAIILWCLLSGVEVL